MNILMVRSYIVKNPLLTSILLFVFLFVIIQMTKPGFLYNDDGSLRSFGVGYRKKTILPVWLLSIVMGILSYVFVLYYISKV